MAFIVVSPMPKNGTSKDENRAGRGYGSGVKRLESLGYDVELKPKNAAA
jgi:hypothetical protein